MGSCMVALDRATTANGCLKVVRRSHKLGRILHEEPSPELAKRGGAQSRADPERLAAVLGRPEHEVVMVEMEPGDACFLCAVACAITLVGIFSQTCAKLRRSFVF